MLIDFHTHRTSDSSVFAIHSYTIKEVKLLLNLPYCSIGLHPWYIQKDEIESSLLLLEKYIHLPHVLFIGECGLDKVCETPFELQTEVFEAQIALSEQYKKPLIIHCVRAFPELIAYKKKYNPIQPWVVHGFSNNAYIATSLMHENIILSYGAAVLQFGSNAQKNIIRFKQSPFFLETDNSTANIECIYAKVCDLLSLTNEELIEMQKTNIKKLIRKNIVELD